MARTSKALLRALPNLSLRGSGGAGLWLLAAMQANINNDGIVSVSDVLLLLGQFGMTCE